MNNAETADIYRNFVEAVHQSAQAAGYQRLSCSFDRSYQTVANMANPNLPDKQFNVLQLAEVVKMSKSPAIAQALAAMTGHVVVESRLLAADLEAPTASEVRLNVLTRQLSDASAVGGALVEALADLKITRDEFDSIESAISAAIQGLNGIRATLGSKVTR
jgi:hypothetical protein